MSVESTASPTARTWRFGTGTVVVIGIAAAIMYGMAVVLFCLPLIVGRSDPVTDGMVRATGLIIAGFAVFMTFGAVAMARTRVSVSATDLEATVPSGHNWLLVPRFRTIVLPLARIRSVERRQEAFRSFGMTVLRDSLSVVTGDGERFGIFSNTSGPASQLPLDEIADAIAAGAGTTVTDAGTVWTKTSGLYGAASSSWTEPRLDDTRAVKVHHRATVTAQVAMMLILFVVVLRACA
jgi:hypothetical protein